MVPREVRDMSELHLQEWYKFRQRTMLIGLLHKAIFIFEYSSVAISALYYYEHSIENENPKFYYSLSMAIVYFTALFSSLIGGAYIDRTGRLREVVILTILLSLCGNILYLVTYSKWFPILGRALCGLAEGARPGFAGDMARAYSPDELVVVLSNIQIAATTMYALAPCSPVFFKNVDITLLGLRVNQYNCVALVMFILLVIFGMLTFFFMSNLTKHPGYQIYLGENKNKADGDQAAKSIRNNNTNEETILSIADIVTDFDLLVVLLGSGLIGFIYCLGEISINMVAMLEFKWTLTRVSVVTLLCVFVATVSMKLLQQLKGTTNTFYLYTVCVVLNWLFMALLLFTLNVQVTVFSWQVSLFFTFLMLNIIAGFNSTAWARSLCFSIVPGHSSSTVDGCRYSISKAGCCLGFFVASFAYSNSSVAYPIITVLCVVEYICLVVSRKRFVQFVQ